MNGYITKDESQAINNSSQALQNTLAGTNLMYALSSGINPEYRWYVDRTNGSDSNDLNYGHSPQMAFKTIQHAVDMTGNGRGDLIIVLPTPSAKYTENVVIYGHQSIKIIAPFGPWTTRIRPSDATTKYAFTPGGGVATQGACFIVMSRDVEIAGFNFDGGGGYAGIYCGDGQIITDLGYTGQNTAGCYFHDNEFQSGNDAYYGLVLQGCSDNVRVVNNVFNWTTQAGVYMCCGGTKTNQRTIIDNNKFLGCMDYGVYLTNDVHYNTCVTRNTFFDRLPGTTVMTRSCLFQGAYGNVFTGNYDATTNGALGSATDYMSGNTEFHAMNTPVYIAEA